MNWFKDFAHIFQYIGGNENKKEMQEFRRTESP